MEKKFYFLSGVPRSGSNLLSSLLSQNPKIHAEGKSHVCQMMGGIVTSCLNDANDSIREWNEDLFCCDRISTAHKIISSIPHQYYSEVQKEFILDKFFGWTLPLNYDIITNFITKEPKIIVLLRPVEEIIQSFVSIKIQNNWPKEKLYSGLLEEDKFPIWLPAYGIAKSREENPEHFLYIKYDEIIENPKNIIEKIYEFCKWEKYEHDFFNIERKYVQQSEIYNLKGVHDVRSTINKRKHEVILPDDILEKCYHLNKMIGL
jgi:sulfotransferase